MASIWPNIEEDSGSSANPEEAPQWWGTEDGQGYQGFHSEVVVKVGFAYPGTP